MKSTYRFYPGDTVPEWLVERYPNSKTFKKGTIKFTKKTKVVKKKGVNSVYFKKGFTFCLVSNALNIDIVCNMEMSRFLS